MKEADKRNGKAVPAVTTCMVTARRGHRKRLLAEFISALVNCSSQGEEEEARYKLS